MSEKLLKIILDTNVLIASCFNRRSASARIIDGCIEGEYKLVISSRLRREAELILKNVKAGEEFLKGIRELFGNAYLVRPTRRVFAVEEDPEDNKFLECACEGNADYLITSDRHLLRLGVFEQTRICKPTQFLRLRDIELSKRACRRRPSTQSQRV
jgi:putative PIN family toxin of toxin-antitoxin system